MIKWGKTLPVIGKVARRIAQAWSRVANAPGLATRGIHQVHALETPHIFGKFGGYDQGSMKHPDRKPASHGRANSSPRILVVDDDIDIRELLVRALGQLGYDNVDSATDGANAWEALHEANYCLVITDHKMPRVTGLELIAQMRSEGMLMPVILISGTMPEEELNRNPGLRVDARLPKPFNFTTLLAMVEKLLQAGDCAAGANGNPVSRSGEPAPKNSSRRILVVDDDRESRQLKVDLLACAGYQVETANDGAAGWEALRISDYDLVITDNHMPRMTGLEMIEKLHFSRMTIPVIMATSQVPTDEFARKPWLTPEVTLQKPFTDGDLLDAISNVLGAGGGNEDHKAAPLPKCF